MVLALVLSADVFLGWVQPWHVIILAFLLGAVNSFDAHGKPLSSTWSDVKTCRAPSASTLRSFRWRASLAPRWPELRSLL